MDQHVPVDQTDGADFCDGSLLECSGTVMLIDTFLYDCQIQLNI